jgi:putative heme-binding domain-containing protein
VICDVHAGQASRWSFVLPAVAAGLAMFACTQSAVQAQRVPWTTGSVTGSPDPPPAFRTSRKYQHLKFDGPLMVRTDPTLQRIWICQRDGKVFSFAAHRDVDHADLFLDAAGSLAQLTPHDTPARIGYVYGLAFHPQYPSVPYCWITYTLVGKGGRKHLEDGTRLSRFRVTFDADGTPRCDVASERVLLTWLEGGHNGACLEFGPDGMLYVSAGDGEVPNPPDPRRAGQDVTNLLSSILRIDVSVDEAGPAYTVPDDNPFVDLPDARPEIWAYGFRNPWKMTFAPDGQLWVGDVGWELYEMIYRVERGGNYGWSIMEGPQPVYPDGQRGPTPIIPPAVALPHSDAASITGGYVYRGQRFPELKGKYIFGDFETRRIWSSVQDGNSLSELTDLVDPTVRLVAFGEDPDGELLLLDYDDGTIHELVRNDVRSTNETFPRQLSETGIFTDVTELTPSPGVLPYSINAPFWQDGATAVRHVAVPGDSAVPVLRQQVRRKIGMLREAMTFPTDSVLTRTVSLNDDNGRDIRLETQILHFEANNWKGYTYVWNTEQTDATLAASEGATLHLSDYGQFADRSAWVVHSRAECVRCHNPWAGGALGFTLPQLNRASGDNDENQIASMRDLGLLNGAIPDTPGESTQARVAAITNPYATDAAPDARARSYLAVNCAHCHQNGAGGTATIDLRRAIALDATKTVDSRAVQGTFSLRDPEIIVPGDPSRSVLLYRMSCSGRGRMPHIGSSRVDVVGVRLMRNWIRGLSDNESSASGVNVATEPVVIPDTSVALELVERLDESLLSDAERDAVLAATREAPFEIAGLFARFQPLEFRATLNTVIDHSAVLTLTGDPARGDQIFQDKRLQCTTCHRIGTSGGQVGPPMDDVGKRLSPAEILHSILEPSKKIDPKYTAWTAVTVDGQVVAGLLIARGDESITLRTSKPEDITIARDKLEDLFPQTVSLMPDRLLSGLTSQQIADLTSFLAEQKAVVPSDRIEEPAKPLKAGQR